MKFPYKVSKFTKDEIDVFNNYFANNNEYIFEGVWFRSQNKENKINSGYVDDTTKRRRTLHYRHTFYIENDYLMVKDSYIYLSVRLPLDEYYDYVNSIKEEFTDKAALFEDGMIRIQLNDENKVVMIDTIKDTTYEKDDVKRLKLAIEKLNTPLYFGGGAFLENTVSRICLVL